MAISVTVYTRPDCKLCKPVIETIERVGEEIDLDFETVDISDDAELTRKYGNEIPVVAVEGRKAFKGRMTEQAFRKRLDKASKSQTRGADAPSVEALENLEPRPWIPARAVSAFLAVVVFGAFGYQVAEGMSDVRVGRGRVAAELLEVKKKDEAPIPFTLETLDGSKRSLSDYAGKVVFLNYWATWCPPCIEEMPSMRRLAQRFANDDRFVMLAVSTDEEWAPVREFFAKEPAPFQVLLDPSGKIASQYGTTKFPETYIIVDGRLVGHIIGPRDWDEWFAEGYLQAVLQNGPI
ncbi:MAG: redoxin domain-containing protein [Deltaproteobacteria bacterium]